MQRSGVAVLATRLWPIAAFVALVGAITPGPNAEPRERPNDGVASEYGANPAAGHTFTHDGIKLYYETYGSTGVPLLVIHGNGGSIGWMESQIDFFRAHYRVIAMDSRDHGRSGDSPGKLTYEKMADDLAALLDHLDVGPADVLGWSDGGIEALLLGMRHPGDVKKLVAMAPNLTPDGLYPAAIAMFRSTIEDMPAEERETPEGKRELKVTRMALVEPNIPANSLDAIHVPTLIIVGDNDLVRTEHAMAIFDHLSKGALWIAPNATHSLPFDDPALFDDTVDRFLRTPFVKKQPINNIVNSYTKLEATLPAQEWDPRE